jgi:hypothetical protein
MPDSPSPKTERRVQLMFRKFSIFSYLALFLTVMAFDWWLQKVEIRSDGPSRPATVRFYPIPFDSMGFVPARLAGAWRVEVDDPRFGGVSALAIDGERLLALTDSGTVIRLPKPGNAGQALVRDLPAGPGAPQFKVNRDSEALARDPAGRGWWVAFEHWHQLWLYDWNFHQDLARVDLGRGRWPANRGVEAMIPDGARLALFPEGGDEWLTLDDMRSRPLSNRFGSISESVRLPDGQVLLAKRQFGIGGIAKSLLIFDERRGALRLLARLGLGATDNVEAMAAEPRANGTRLWLMTDNDFRPRAPTLLVALDLP